MLNNLLAGIHKYWPISSQIYYKVALDNFYVCVCLPNNEAPQLSYLWTYDLYGPIRNAFDAAKSITRTSVKGLGPENWDFSGPVKLYWAIRRVPYGAQKCRNFQGPTRSHFPK